MVDTASCKTSVNVADFSPIVKVDLHNVDLGDSSNVITVNRPIETGMNTIIFVYAVISAILSACLPLIDSLSRKTIESLERGQVEHEFFLEVFHVGQYGVAVICIIILTTVIGRSRKTCCCCSNENPEQVESQEADGEEEGIAPLATPESGRVNVKKESSPSDAYVVLPPHDDQGVNLYLRLGTLGFGFGVMIYDGFKISDNVHSERHECSHSHLWIPKYSIHFLYIFMQTFFIVKHYNFNFLRFPCLTHFCLVHLVVTNIGQWFKIVIYEVSEGVVSHEKNVTHSNIQCVGLSSMLAPFLFPCAVEYSILAAAISFRLLRISLGWVHHSGAVAPTRVSLSVQAINQRYNECHRAHKGLFFGLLLLMLTLVSMAVFFLFTKQLHSVTTFLVYQITETGLLGITFIGAVWALICVRCLHRFSNRVWDMEIGLLCIGFVGVVFHDMLLLIPAVSSAAKGHMEGILFIVTSCVELMQAVAQVLLIIEGQRRCATSVADVRRKPGRAVITCLLLSNLALWLVNTFEVKFVVEESFQAEYYNKTAWGILARVLLPLTIFFRFHSSVCLSAIWNDVYKLRG